MRRIATLGVAGCTLALAMCWAMEVAVACVDDIFPELKEHAAAIARLRAQRESFETRLGAIAVEVALGRQSLRDASSALEDVAVAQYPPYLRYIESVETGRTARTKLAGQLVSHMRAMVAGEHQRLSGVRLADITREFEDMLADETNEVCRP
jgi:hypothetical protein